MNPALRLALLAAIKRGDLTIAEVAERAGLSHQAVRKWITADQAKAARKRRADEIFNSIRNKSETRRASKKQLRRLHDNIMFNVQGGS